MSRIPERDIIVIGGSAGALQPLKEILRSLPSNLQAAVFVVLHVSADTPEEVVLSMADVGSLPVRLARHGDVVEHGQVYIAPPDHHVLIGIDDLRVTRGPHENRTRPAIDPTLRTAANVFDGRVIAVILSGDLNDGTYGGIVVKAQGGTVIVQDPMEADYPSMPRSVVDRGLADHVLKTSEIGPKLTSLVWSPLWSGGTGQANSADADADELERVSAGVALPDGNLSPFSCPECFGPLWVKEDGSISLFRCHTGHAFTGEALLASQRHDVEGALWSAVRALDEHAQLYKRLGQQALSVGAGNLSDRHFDRARENEANADLIRSKLLM